MKIFLSLYGIAATLFVIIDAIWLMTIANSFYKDKLGKLLAEKPNLGAAVLFYAIYLIALVIFVIKPGVSQSLWEVQVSHHAELHQLQLLLLRHLQ